MPLGVAGILQLNVILVIVGVEVKSLGVSSGPIVYYLELFQMYTLLMVLHPLH